MERIIANNVMRHLTENHLLSDVQHGFVKRRSTCTNLLESLNDWTLAIQDGHSVVVGYIDFNMAFDSVSHEKLFYCLNQYGVRSELLLWLTHFFQWSNSPNPSWCLIILSSDLLSGVVQGSGIGPVTFIIFIDGLAKLLEAHSIQCKIFADDVKKYITVQNVNCTSKLQAALNLISAWADDWQLPIYLLANVVF